MPFRVQIGPHQVPIHHGQTVLVSEPDGQINPPSDKGLYFFDTRVISSWTIYANGEPWDLLNGGAITHYASQTYLTNRRIPTANGIIPQRTLGLVVSRMISDGMHEDVDITNNSNDCSRARPTERSVCQWPAQLRSRNCLGVHARDETVNWSAGTWVQFAEPCARPHANSKILSAAFLGASTGRFTLCSSALDGNRWARSPPSARDVLCPVDPLEPSHPLMS